jgi:non-ribosomal peptide synthetase component F
LQDFALNDESVVSAYKYWRQQLREGRLPVLELPLDFARPAAQSFEGCTVPVVFSVDTVRQLDALSLEYGSTLFNVLLALWVLLLCRHSAQDEVVVGVPADKKTCLSDSPIALLLAVPHGSSFASLVSMATEAISKASAHAHVPLQAVIEELYPHNAHDTSHHPIFQTMFAFHDLRRWENAAACDISFTGSVVESGRLDGAVCFRADLFEHSSIQRLAARLQVLVAALVAEPAAADVWALPLIASDEAEHVLWTFNDTVTALPMNECIHDLVAAQAVVTSQAVALDWHGSKMMYAELMDCAAKVAGWLRSNGVAPDCVVALQLHRSLEQVVSMLGTLLSGGAYLPLDPKWPSERRRFMIQDAECKQLIAQPIYLSDFSWFCDAVLPLDNARSLPETHARWPVQSSMPEKLAYVMYTSGSTGKPKGVMVPHIGVVNLLLGARLRYQCSTDSMFGVPTPYVFDVSVYNIFTSLVVHCGTCQLLQDGSSLATLAANDKLTRVAAVPSILAIARLPPSTKHVEVGGEALTQRAVDNVPTHTHIYNYYGYAHPLLPR